MLPLFLKEHTMMLLGIVFIALGCLGLVYQGMTFVTKKKLAQAGHSEVNEDTTATVWFPPIVAATLLIAGLALMAL